jgi:hypothetical protein
LIKDGSPLQTSTGSRPEPGTRRAAWCGFILWREQQQRWDRLHYARVAIIIAGLVLTLVATTVA